MGIQKESPAALLQRNDRAHVRTKADQRFRDKKSIEVGSTSQALTGQSRLRIVEDRLGLQWAIQTWARKPRRGYRWHTIHRSRTRDDLAQFLREYRPDSLTVAQQRQILAGLPPWIGGRQ